MNNQDTRCKEILEDIIPLLEELENICGENSTYWFANDSKLEAKKLLEECSKNERF
ncbi:TPA: hypothetical protein ACXDAZ_002515 [Clostridium botulinum]